MRYEIRYIKPLTRPNGEVEGGDDEWYADAATKSKAFAIAKRGSKEKGVYETTVHEYANGRGEDFTGHWYFEKGKLTWDMGGNN